MAERGFASVGMADDGEGSAAARVSGDTARWRSVGGRRSGQGIVGHSACDGIGSRVQTSNRVAARRSHTDLVLAIPSKCLPAQCWPRPPCPQVLEIALHLFRAGWQRDLVDGGVYPLHACPHGGACATLGGSPRRGLTDKVVDVDRINGRFPIDDVAGALVPRIKVERWGGV